MNLKTQATYALARQIGMPIVHGEYQGFRQEDLYRKHKKEAGTPFWDGRILYVISGGHGDVLHEISHFLEAEQSDRRKDPILRRKNLANWGLEGSDLTEKEKNDIEERAGMIELGIDKTIDALTVELAHLMHTV